MSETALLTRFATPRLIEALEDSPAVLIHGPRQCGKTTLAPMACAPSVPKADGGLSPGRGRRSPGARGAGERYEYVGFDDDVARIAAETDPMGFAAGLGERVILDEVQRAPMLFTALKAEIDRLRAGPVSHDGLDASPALVAAPGLAGRPAPDIAPAPAGAMRDGAARFGVPRRVVRGWIRGPAQRNAPPRTGRPHRPPRLSIGRNPAFRSGRRRFDPFRARH